MKDLKTIRGRAYLQEMISQGEHENQDFKYLISDARKIARSISAFANNSGGRLLIGVKDNGTIAGVRNEEDVYMIEQAAQMYCSPPQQVEFTAFNAGDGLVVIRAGIAAAPQRPVMAQDYDKKWRAYFRVADENIAAHPLMVRAWRHMASGRRSVFRLDGPEAAIMTALPDEESTISISEALRIAGASRRTAESAVIRLVALGVACFVYTPAGFVLRRLGSDDNTQMP